MERYMGMLSFAIPLREVAHESLLFWEGDEDPILLQNDLFQFPILPSRITDPHPMGSPHGALAPAP
jgi:hypothetical protein